MASSQHAGIVTILDCCALLLEDDWCFECFEVRISCFHRWCAQLPLTILVHTALYIPQVLHKPESRQIVGSLLQYISLEDVNGYAKSKAIHLLTRIFTGFRPLYLHPSMDSQTPDLVGHRQNQRDFAAAVLEEHMKAIEAVVVDLADTWLYSPTPREHFMGTAPRGASLVATLLRFITVAIHSSPHFDAIALLEKAVSGSK